MEPVDVTVVHFPSSDDVVLEGDLLAPSDARGAAVVCHPHPLYGGSRHDAVVAAITRGLVGTGHRVLRFDFRGTGGSTGRHDGGRGERDDLSAAIDHLGGEELVVVAGYSFGADVALACDHVRTGRWIVAAPPLAVVGVDEMTAPTSERTVDLIHAAHDQFAGPDQIRNTTAGWTATTTHLIDGTDHFFSGAHRRVTELVEELSAG